MRRIGLLLGALAVLSLVACSDDDVKKDTGTSDGGVDTGVDVGTTDGTAADQTPAPDAAACVESVIGTPCTESGGECGAGGICLLTDSTGATQKGVCTCTCTPAGPLQADDCPGSGTGATACGSVPLSDGTTADMCFKSCNPTIGTATCSGGMVCDPRSGASVGMWDMAVCAFYGGCTEDSDCEVTTGETCDPSATTSTCTGGATCLALTSTSTTDGLCAVDGSCDTTSGLCKPHTSNAKSTAKVGDPCKGDAECAANQICLLEFDETKYLGATGASCTDDDECCSGDCDSTTSKCTTGACVLRNRNGYCAVSGCAFSSLTDFQCDSGSVCNELYSGGLCFKTCSLGTASDCRGNANDKFGDYECRDWSTLSVNNKAFVSSPTCEGGSAYPCDMIESSNLDCSVVGDQSNSTNMTCRDLNNTKLTDKYDPAGFCFDDTASGAVTPAP